MSRGRTMPRNQSISGFCGLCSEHIGAFLPGISLLFNNIVAVLKIDGHCCIKAPLFRT